MASSEYKNRHNNKEEYRDFKPLPKKPKPKRVKKIHINGLSPKEIEELDLDYDDFE